MPEVASEVDIGHGTVVSVSTDDGTTFVDLVGVEDVEFPAGERDEVNRSHQQSPGRVKEFGPAMIDNGVMTVPVQYVPGSPTDVLLKSIFATGEIVQLRITTNVSGETPETWAAWLKSYKRTAPINDKQMSSAEFRINGAVA